MNDYARLSIAKEAAITIVDTLTVADRVAIVTFSDTASRLGGFDTLIRATIENKKLLVEAIGNLEAEGATNFYDAFDLTFEALEATHKREATSGCNIAVLFLTDGQITIGRGAEEVVDLVNAQAERFVTEYGRKTTVFTFSLGTMADHTVTKTIACSTNGIWTAVDDFAGDLVATMSSYYKLFALGLGEGGNENFVAWVGPYPFANPAGKIGTTVSVPVYDRSVSPPLFLGVVASDMYMDALEKVLGEDAASSTMLERFILRSTARCPRIELTECEVDALRFLGGGEEAMCGACNATFTGIVPERCPSRDDLPKNLWHNTDVEGESYEDRACCAILDPKPRELSMVISDRSHTDAGLCPKTSAKTASSQGQTNIGMIVGVVAAAIALALGICVWKRKATKESKQTNQSSESKNTDGGGILAASATATNFNSPDQQQQADADAERMVKRLSSLEGVTPVMPPAEASAPPLSIKALEIAP